MYGRGAIAGNKTAISSTTTPVITARLTTGERRRVLMPNSPCWPRERFPYSTCAELLEQCLPHGFRVRRSRRQLHHLAHQPPDRRLLAAPHIRRHFLVLRDHLIAPALQSRLVADDQEP